jgi:hypothetical protein
MQILLVRLMTSRAITTYKSLFFYGFTVCIILRNVVLFNEESFKIAVSFTKRTLVQKIVIVKSKVLMAVNTKISLISYMMQCGLINGHQNVVECVCNIVQ